MEIRERGSGTGSAVAKGCVIFVVIALALFLLGAIALAAISVAKGVSPADIFKKQEQALAEKTSPKAPETAKEQTQGWEKSTPSTTEQQVPQASSSIYDPVVYVAKKVGPSVVNIKIYGSSVFEPGRKSLLGEGSGVIYSSDGYIITNNHVVAELPEDGSLVVTFASGEDAPARLVGADPLDDIAVIKVEKSGLPPADFGTARTLEIGELAVAIGSPFGLEASVTAGVISALHRNIETGYGPPLVDLIQTDAAINPGNSGGALCNRKGQVVGINTLIVSPSGASAGVGFAIPIDVAISDAEQLIKTGRVSHPFIGIQGVTITAEIAQEFGLEAQKGIYVVEVVPGGPADRAGMRKGDVITKIGGEEVKTFGDLIAILRQYGVGDTVTMTVLRGRETLELRVKLVERPSS